MKITKTMPAVLLACGLAACGGGGGGGDPAPAAAAPDASAPAAAGNNTGSVSAPFVAGAEARYMMLAVGSQSVGKLTTKVQDASGAMTTINTNVLGGTTGVKEIAGDANFAQGRWALGTVTTASGTSTLTPEGNAAYHYAAFNPAASFPATGSLACDGGAFTAPTSIGGASGSANSGIASGSASIGFGASGAVVSGVVNTLAGGSPASVNFSTTLKTPGSSSVTGSFLAGGAGALVTLGADGAGYLVVAGYSTTQASGARYQGVVTFHCK